MKYVTQVSDDPGNDLEWTSWLVIESDAPRAAVEAACRDLVNVLAEGGPPDLQASNAQAELNRRGLAAVVTAAQYVYINS